MASKFSQSTKFFKAVSDESRIKILYFLRDGEKCVCEIWKKLELPQNLVSHHLKVLKDLGLLDSKKDGLKVYYKINKNNLDKYFNNFNKLINS
ncbi:MAG: metalloregulator ArsR/SmtB family transcription factor [Patescibacteria group bacterium]